VAGKVSEMTSIRFTGDGVPPCRVSMEREGGLTSGHIEVPVREGGRPSSGLVLDVGNRTTRTIVFVLHEETVNQFPGMAFYEGVFSEGGVSMRALEHGVVAPYPVRATLDLAGQWRIMGFSRYSISHVVLFCIRQCFGY
jgi:hypothetical protein